MTNTLAVETDTALADIFGKMAGPERTIVSANERLAWYGDDVPEHIAQDLHERKVEAQNQLAVLRAEAAPLEETFAEHRWSRFFLVTNTNGHIHRSMSCSTCFPTTQYAWLPHLSGLTDAEAVADQGEILCSVCFPDAPVEWTDGESNATKAARAEREAKKSARQQAKVDKALVPSDPEGGYVCVGGRFNDRVKTVHAAKAWLRDYAWWSIVRDGHPSFHPEDAEAIAALLVGRPKVTEGDTADEIIQTLWDKVEKKARKEGVIS